MQFQKILVPLAGVALVVAAYRAFGWGGVAVALGALVMWVLLHFTRMMQVLRRAADRPIGFVDSAVMLNAKLKPGVNLLHVVAMTRALGELVSPKDSQPELFRWTDASESFVTCEFRQGKLVTWELVRPTQPEEATTTPPAPAP
ncbi:MAG: glycerate kinase [Rhodoferax sp.]|uniref:glycerate kinase n=1 Tax=Rhodoferax sp. TaxID=50421 RepID=UPI00272FB8F6|nr:glycerate kinase [Rhodoferax sp.]MDP1527844.1 glycerate kinase [Rhodoferax sp.]MDP1938593.1 glycerate kinase [Hylemonella sp.]